MLLKLVFSVEVPPTFGEYPVPVCPRRQIYFEFDSDRLDELTTQNLYDKKLFKELREACTNAGTTVGRYIQRPILEFLREHGT
jgi:hypothetical protein